MRTCDVLPALALATVLMLGPERRVADFRVGATNADETLVAIEAGRAITYRWQDATLRSVPLDDPAKATIITLPSPSVADPIAAPPLFVWMSYQQTVIAPIDAPDRGTVLPRVTINSMKCNAKACLATTADELLFLRLDGTISARQPGVGVVLTSDPDGFLLLLSQTLPLHLTRVANDGTPTFSSPAPLMPSNAAADFDGTRYAVVWPDNDIGAGTSTLRAVAVSSDGKVSAPLTLAAFPTRQDGRLALACNGGRHLLVFAQPDTNPYSPNDVPRTRLRALRLDDALQPLDAKPFIVDETTWAAADAAVIARGSEFLVGWTHVAESQPGDPEAAVVDAGGKAGPRMLLSRGIVQQEATSVAAVPGALLASYLEFPKETGMYITTVRRFGPDGAAAGEPAILERIVASTMVPRGSDVFIASFTGGFYLNTAILRADGSLRHVDAPADFVQPSIAASPNGWLLVIARSDDVIAIRVDPNGNASAPETVVFLPGGHFRAAVASDSDRFLIAWASGAAGSRLCGPQPCGTHATLLDATGGILKPNLALSAQADLTEAAFAGGEYFVGTASRGLRLDRDGNLLGDVNVHASHVVAFGNAVLVSEAGKESTRLVVFDHGDVAAETTVDAVAPRICAGGIAYTVDAGGTKAAVFRMFVTERRRAASHSRTICPRC